MHDLNYNGVFMRSDVFLCLFKMFKEDSLEDLTIIERSSQTNKKQENIQCVGLRYVKKKKMKKNINIISRIN